MSSILSIDLMKKIFKAEYAELNAIHEYLKKFLKEHHVNEELLFKTMVFSEEIMTNISRYAYPENDGINNPIEIDIRIINKKRIVMEISDYGIAFDPLTYHKPEKKSEVELGGFGLILVKKITHKLKYRRENNRNIITAIITSHDSP